MWMDKVSQVLGRKTTYDRRITPLRKKPFYAGYVGGVIKAHGRLQDRFLGPWYLRCIGLGRCSSCCSDPPLQLPALLLTTPFDDSNPPPKLTVADIGEGGDHAEMEGVDDHVDVKFVRSVFRMYFGNKVNKNLQVDKGMHEMLQSNEAEIVKMLKELKDMLKELKGQPKGPQGRPMVRKPTKAHIAKMRSAHR